MVRPTRIIGPGWIMVLVVLGAACGRELTGPTPPTPAPSAPSPPAGPITVSFSGTVFEKTQGGRRPAAAVQVRWCDQNGCAHDEPVVTGDDGRFAITAANAQNHAYVSAEKAGFRPGRSRSFVVAGAVTADIEIAPALNGVFGMVFEATPTGPQPLEGVVVTQCDDIFTCSEPVTTAADGTFRIDLGEWSGVTYFDLTKVGFERHTLTIDVVGMVEVHVELTPLADLCGGSDAGGVPLLSTPFVGLFRISNFFDHDLPIGSADRNRVQLNACGASLAGRLDGHSGYDWVMPEGTPLYAATDGTVTTAGTRSPFTCSLLGRTVIDQVEVWVEVDGTAHRTGYLHLSQVSVEAGQRVGRGDLIGYSGITGCSTGPHLHFEVRSPRGRPTDPFGWQGTTVDPWEIHPNGESSTWLWMPGEAPRSPDR